MSCEGACSAGPSRRHTRPIALSVLGRPCFFLVKCLNAFGQLLLASDTSEVRGPLVLGRHTCCRSVRVTLGASTIARKPDTRPLGGLSEQCRRVVERIRAFGVALARQAQCVRSPFARTITACSENPVFVHVPCTPHVPLKSHTQFGTEGPPSW